MQNLVAASLPATALCKQLSEVSVHVHSSVSMGQKWHACLDQIRVLAIECSKPGWDGESAPSLSPQVFHHALAFIRTLPQAIPVPEIAATAGGEISFEWAQHARRVVTVVVAENGEVHYAALFGQKKNHGSYPLSGVFEPELRGLIEMVLG